MIWPPDLMVLMRLFLVILAIVFVVGGTMMLALALPLGLPWAVHTDLAARYAVIFLAIAVVCMLGVTVRSKG